MANEVRLIDANALFYRLVNTDPNTHGRFCDGVAKAMEFILNAPTIDPESLRPKGRWIERKSIYAEGGISAECSVCNKSVQYLGNPLNYCPNCGAKMEG